MTYSPIDKLGSTNTSVNFSFTSNFILENTATVIETILNSEVLYNNIYDNYISTEFTGNSIIFTGNVPLEVFDQYQLTYVDKGKSDKNQIPVVSTIGNMPDHKELYKIQPDSRVSIEIPITINLEIQKKTISTVSSVPSVPSETPTEGSEQSGESSSSETIEIINEIINYTLEVMNDLNFISNWTKNYFENRY